MNEQQNTEPVGQAQPGGLLPPAALPGEPDPETPSRVSGVKGGLKWPWPLVISLVVMVLSLGGIGATIGVAYHTAHSTPGYSFGQFPGAGTYTGQRPGGFASGNRPGFANGQFPSGFPTDGIPNQQPGSGASGGVPSGFPTDGTQGGSGGNRGSGTVPGGFPSAGAQGQPANFQPGQFTGQFSGQYGGSGGTRSMSLSLIQILIVIGCSLLFVAAVVYLVLSAIWHKRQTRLAASQQAAAFAQDAWAAGQAGFQSATWAAPAASAGAAPATSAWAVPPDSAGPGVAPQVVPDVSTVRQTAPEPVNLQEPGNLPETVPEQTVAPEPGAAATGTLNQSGESTLGLPNQSGESAPGTPNQSEEPTVGTPDQGV